MRKESFLIGALACLAISACSQDDSVRFSPSEGEERRYEIQSQTELTVDTRFGERSQEQMTLMVGRYHVLSDGREPVLAIEPEYFSLKADRQRFSSTETPSGRREQALHSLFSGGFELQLDREGAVKSITAREEEIWQEMLEDLPELAEVLQGQMGQPAATQTIPAEVGHRIESTSLHGLEDLSMVVDDVQDKTLTLSIEGQVDEVKVAGVMVLDRASGWLERMALVQSGDMEIDGQTVGLRQTLIMKGDDWRFPIDLNEQHVWGDDEYLTYDLEWDRSLWDRQAGRDEVFPSDVGRFHDRSSYQGNADVVETWLPHDLPEESDMGQIRVDALEAIDTEGQAMDLTFYQRSLSTYSQWGQGHMQTVGNYLPLGWKDLRREGESLAHFTADVHYHAADTESFTLPVDENEPVNKTVSGSKVTLTPLEGEGEFRIDLVDPPGNRLLWDFTQLDGMEIMMPGPEGASEWLTPWEAHVLEVTRHAARVHRLQMRFEQVPDNLTLQIQRFEDQPSYSETVRFVSRETRFNDPGLWPSPQFIAPAEGGGNSPFAPEPAVATEALEPRREGEELRMVLSQTQAFLCELEAESEAAEGELQWGIDRITMDTDINRRYPATRQWVLQTEAGEPWRTSQGPSHTALRCRELADTVERPLPTGEQPWLVDLEALLGEDWNRDRPLADFLGEYRFLDEAGRPLGVLAANWSDQETRWENETLGELVVDGHYLRIAGTPSTLEQRIAGEVTVEQSWSFERQTAEAPAQGRW